MKIKILLSAIATMAMLTFSAGVATAQSTGAATATESGSPESSQPLSDTVITTKVKAELAITEGIKSGDISVETIDGVVILTGTQPNEALIRKAEAIAMSVKDVKKVDISGLTVNTTTTN